MTKRLMNKQKGDQETGRKTDVHTDRQTDEHTNGASSKSILTFQTEKNRQTHRQTDEETDFIKKHINISSSQSYRLVNIGDIFLAKMSRKATDYLSLIYTGEIQRDNACDSNKPQQPLFLGGTTEDRIVSIFCRVAQGGQGKNILCHCR